MLDDIRDHRPTPSREERAWMSFDPAAAAGRIVVTLLLAIAIGGYVSYATHFARPVDLARR